MMEMHGQWLLAISYGLGCLLVTGAGDRHWLIARASAGFGLLAALAAAVAALLLPVPADALGLTAALLVAVLGWVIVNYSARYLEGEPDQPRFVRAMLFTLSMVGVLVVSDHLAVMVLAWTGTSVGLHRLLTFYRHRKAAQIVAHKKFLVSRLAEVCLLAALVLVYQQAGTLTLDGLGQHLKGVEALPLPLQLAALLFALAAILKTAQLPLHGWLIQVMEAPTPVSALLHAGVVNIGGFFLLRLAALLSLAPAAQTLLVATGTLTAVLASLVMLTRISIKVRLAWSTCAQMGFMLMEIGLGLYELALLHLVAHSLYKAHAFLDAGDTVRQARHSQVQAAGQGHIRPLGYLAAPLLTGVLVAGSVAAWQWWLPALALPWAALVIISLGLAPLLWAEQGHARRQLVRGGLQVLALSQLYLAWHLLFADLAPPVVAVNPLLATGVALCFTGLYILQVWLRCHPGGRLATALHPWAFAGFYLDEAFTRLTFKVWPVRLSPVQAQTLVNRHAAH